MDRLGFEGNESLQGQRRRCFPFPPGENFERINKSAKCLAMPEVTEEMFLARLEALMDIDREWIPQGDGFSLYIRPLIFMLEEALKAS